MTLWKETRSALSDWLAIRPKRADRHLFLNAMGTGMTGAASRNGLSCMRKPLRTACHRSPARPYLPTCCGSHACAIHTLEATGDVRIVSLWLGHSNLQTTEMYLQADPTDKLDTLDKWRPPSLRKGMFKGCGTSCSRCLQAPEPDNFMGT